MLKEDGEEGEEDGPPAEPARKFIAERGGVPLEFRDDDRGEHAEQAHHGEDPEHDGAGVERAAAPPQPRPPARPGPLGLGQNVFFHTSSLFLKKGSRFHHTKKSTARICSGTPMRKINHILSTFAVQFTVR